MPKRTINLDAPFQTFPNAATITGLSVKFMRDAVKDGWAPHIKVGNTTLINIPLFMDALNRRSRERGA